MICFITTQYNIQSKMYVFLYLVLSHPFPICLYFINKLFSFLLIQKPAFVTMACMFSPWIIWRVPFC